MTKTQLLKKLDNICYHYKTHILTGVLVLAAVIPFVFFTKYEKPAALNVTFIGNTIEQKEQQALQKRASAEILKADLKSEIKLNFWRVNGTLASPGNMDIYQKMLAQIAAKDIDIMVLDRSDFVVLSQQGAFKDLDFIKKANNDKKTDKNGMELTGNELLRRAGYNPDNKMMAIISNTQKKATAIKFVKWLVNQTN
ncbi:hypothetical protein PH210_14770 [Paenibacillus sp. BSR1-1]|uniref:hypothetical protein n=1 Tax=Paenibacillus sp. BSR1-1 TaxID=3020845 RepID=UPI0025B00210|nr:hypothetical protein [Paenibacillus sp. BSR1-1]MDN3017458.1 hypothetical protein [Paenibacillus sp. BSR1-1]